MGTPLISPRARLCVTRFQRLNSALLAFKHPDHLLHTVKESSERFDVWATNLGAYHERADPRSTDARLRKASTILTLITQSLDELLDVLEHAALIVDGTRPDASLLEEARSLDSPEDEEVIPETEESELGELCAIISDIITSLLKISILIRQNTNRDRYARAAASEDPPFPRDFDIQRIGEIFPKIKGEGLSASKDKTDEHVWLRERLGNANVLRRQYLRYIRRHHNRLANAALVSRTPKLLSPTDQSASTPVLRPSQASSSRPTLTPTDSSTLNISKLPRDVSEQVLERQDDLDDALSFVSSQSLADSKDGEVKQRIVPLEELSNGHSEFECPYCRGIIQPGTRSKWKKHVFSDLRAYVCTFKDCRTGLFEDRRAWFQHELEVHRRRWVCQVCSESFSKSSDVKEHLRRAHTSRIPTPDMIDFMVAASSRPVAALQSSDCPLCDEWHTELRSQVDKKGSDVRQNIVVSLDDFRRHLGDHLEQIALFAIPPQLDAQPSGSSDSDNDAGQNAAFIAQWQETASDDNGEEEADQGTGFDAQGDLPRKLKNWSLETQKVERRDGHDDALVASTSDDVARPREKVLEASTRTLTDEHPDTLANRANLASTDRKQRRLKEEVKLQEQALETIMQIAGREDPSTLDAVTKLGLLYIHQGKLEEAGKMYVQALQGKEKALGRDHISTLDTAKSLGKLYHHQYRLDEAKTMYMRALQGYEKTLGPGNTLTLETANNLGNLCCMQGRLDEAEAMCMRALQGYEKALGLENTSALHTISNLGKLYSSPGRLDEAKEMYTLAGKKVLGKEHRVALMSTANLALVYLNQGRWKEAEQLQVQVMEASKRVLGEEHPDTLTSTVNLALIYFNQGRWKEAEQLQVQVTETSKRVLGEEHPNTLRTTGNLALIYSNQGRWKEAEQLQVQVMEASKRVLGEEHPKTLRSIASLASTYNSQGRRKEAEQIQVRARGS